MSVLYVCGIEFIKWFDFLVAPDKCEQLDRKLSLMEPVCTHKQK
jgi:hypothetical protein